MDLALLFCWSCGKHVSVDLIDYGAVLVPRSESRGGPVLMLRCPSCGIDNVVERNWLGHHLLIPPTLAKVTKSNLGGSDLARARQWARDNAIDRAEFLARAKHPMEDPEAPEFQVPLAEPDAAEPEEGEGGIRRERVTEIDAVMNAYEVLGVELTATPDEIRKRFRELSKKCHPDRVAGLDEEIRRVAERRFGEIRKAYAILIGD